MAEADYDKLIGDIKQSLRLLNGVRAALEQTREQVREERRKALQATTTSSHSKCPAHPSWCVAFCQSCEHWRELLNTDNASNQHCRSCGSAVLKYTDFKGNPIPDSEVSRMFASPNVWRE